jgi:hypothetical protein
MLQAQGKRPPAGKTIATVLALEVAPHRSTGRSGSWSRALAALRICSRRAARRPSVILGMKLPFPKKKEHSLLT